MNERELKENIAENTTFQNDLNKIKNLIFHFLNKKTSYS